ncbi:MAG: ATP-dependent DNA helicase RecG [Cytophagales bacterium]|nr:ATP-dependent DNA helicase RecG [Cytophagales bacterium]MDW8383613.1 ATP-dependent DNA helicase RecG [Flammeovirgaceae bacterium]
MLNKNVPFLETKIEYLKEMGPQRAMLLNTELGIFTFRELLEHYPFRHEDRSCLIKICQLSDEMPCVQIQGRITEMRIVGEGTKKRLVATFKDETGSMELVWFQAISWIQKNIKPYVEYIVFGKVTRFGDKFNMVHPEIDVLISAQPPKLGLTPIYHTTEKLKKRGLDSKGISKLLEALIPLALPYIQETLPGYILEKYKLISKSQAVQFIHFPENIAQLQKAKARLKFEELFYIQLRLLHLKTERKQKCDGQVFQKTQLLTHFYKNYLPFDLTDAQKRVIREIFQDLKSGKQMNRLLQGDVGSGKTIVAFICMLLAIDNNAQACLMAPTEILATQHFQGLKPYSEMLNISMALLTGSTKKTARTKLLEDLEKGDLKIIIGTHALLEDSVKFHNLGLCIIDEQHRFGVAQRAKLWEKQSKTLPHVLVMTATPIPRTLAMTLYGDLDVSIIDELPAGRKPIHTLWFSEKNRLRVFGLMKQEIQKGRQVYVVYPVIEESEQNADLKDLLKGYEVICQEFPQYRVSILHGRMKPNEKEAEMQAFKEQKTHIMVATTVIEVGVNVPNATMMVIENAERFGLAQLHQLRGRVGRGAEQSYCILISGDKISKEARFKLSTMVRTTNGFEIADADLKLRGPGDLAGTQQSGILQLRFADLSQDAFLVQETRAIAQKILEDDPLLERPEHQILKQSLFRSKQTMWSKIS